MAAYRRNIGDGLVALFRSRRVNRGATWGLMIVGALLAFELFNFSTTQFALTDVLGTLTFAGIARIFTPEQGRDEPAEVWYLFGAWLLAAGFNATLTWWGVSIAIANHTSLGEGAVISSATMLKVVPVFVAVMVWLIRVLIIGTFSLAGDRLFTTDEPRVRTAPRPLNQAALRPASSINRPAASTSTFRPAPKAVQQTSFSRQEPTYHNASFSERTQSNERYDA
ncbi:MAG TPA: hypothetical protein VGJ22_07385 [Anaerolineales bacterium]